MYHYKKYHIISKMKDKSPVLYLFKAVLIVLLPILCYNPAFSQTVTDSITFTFDSTSLEATTSHTDTDSVTVKLTNPIDPVYKVLTTSKILGSILVLVLTYFGINIGIRILRFLAEKNTRHRLTITGLIPLFRISTWSVSIFIVIAGIISPSMATVIAFSASVAVAVGFASQDILKNIFGGIMIIFDQPFKVGDKIEIGSYYGEVIEIGLRSTRIVTPDDSVVSVPNSEVMNQSVSNANTGEPNCQVVAEFYLPIDVDTERVRKIAIEGAQVSRYIYLDKPIVVLFFQEMFEDRSYLKMRLKAYVMDIRFEFPFKSDMTELVLRALLEEGIISREDYS